MEIKHYLIIFTGIIPFVIYAVLFTILGIRLFSNKLNKRSRHLLLRHIISLFIIGALYLIFSLTAFLGNDKDMKLQTDLLIMSVYTISLSLSCINYLHSRFINKIPRYLTIIEIVFSLVVISAFVYVFIASDHSLLTVILKLFVILTVFFLIYDYLYNYYKQEFNSLWNKILYVRMMSFHNFIFLFYLIKLHPALDLILTIYAYMAIHVVEFYLLFGHKKNQRYNYISDENSILSESFNNASKSGGVNRNMTYENLNDYEKEAISLKNRLLLYFEQEKPFLSKNISIEDVAMKLYTNKTYLSKTINEELNKNFRELVNYFRIKEAIKIFSRNMEISMSELMDRSGFNNNASFTSAFKVNTGQTPGEWCRDIKNRN